MTIHSRKLRPKQRRKAESRESAPLEADVSVCPETEDSALVCAEIGKIVILQSFQHRSGRVPVPVIPAAGDEYKIRTDKREKRF